MCYRKSNSCNASVKPLFNYDDVIGGFDGFLRYLGPILGTPTPFPIKSRWVDVKLKISRQMGTGLKAKKCFVGPPFN